MKDLLNRVSIKHKLLAMLIVSVTSIVLLVALEIGITQQLALLENTRATSQHLTASQLQLRRHEKDFLARSDIKYADRFNQTAGQMLQQQEILSANLVELDLQQAFPMQAIKSNLQAYQQSFARVSQLKQELGLTPTTGLYGSLRAAVHAAESQVNQQNNWQLLSGILMLRRAEKDFMLRLDSKYIDKFNNSMQSFKSTLQSASLSTTARAEINSAMQTYAAEFARFTDKTSQLGLTPQQGEMGKMRASVQAAEEQIAQMTSAMESMVEGEISDANQLYLLIAFIILVTTLFLISLVYASINRPLQAITQSMNEAGENRDLSVRCRMQGNHEIARLANVFDQMMENFSNVLDRIDQASEQVAASSSQLSHINVESVENLKQQQYIIEQVATAMTEMAVSVQEVSQNVSETSESADDAFNETAKGKQIVSGAIGSVETLVETINETKIVLDQLNADSQDVSKVLEVIRGVAEQTNLLALNAAIEAARAGEQGRGFAVVADEVRTLAGRTQESTEEINQIIEKLQSNSRRAVEVMEKSQLQVSETVSQAKVAGDSLETVTDKVNRINDMSSQIASASEEQHAVANEVNEKVISINDSAIHNTEISEQTAEASQEQAQLARELKNLVAEFRH